MRGTRPLLSALNLIFGLVSVNAHAATMQIVDLEDVDFGQVQTTATKLEQRLRFCVVSDPAGPYQISAYGSGPGGAFVLSVPGLATTIGFDAYISKQRGRPGDPLVPGVPVTGLSAKPRLRNGRCHPPYVNLLIDINENDLSAAPGGRYAAILQITVAPE